MPELKSADLEKLYEHFWAWMRDTYKLGFGEMKISGMDMTPYWEYFLANRLTPMEKVRYFPDFDWPEEITEEKQAAWQKYKAAGGFFSLKDWIERGAPTSINEKAATAFVRKMRYWLDYLVSRGMDKTEAEVLAQDVIDSLRGQGKYKGKPKTVFELERWIYTGVQDYMAGIPIAAQKRIEKEALVAQQEAQVIAKQRMELPFYAKGMTADQIKTGYQAIRGLEEQLSVSPEYLRPTIKRQIGALQESISQLRESERLRARTATEAEEQTSQKIRIRAEEEARLEPKSASYKFAEKYGMSPEVAQRTAADYYYNMESERFAHLTPEEKRDISRVAMSEMSPGGERVEPAPPFEPPEFRAIGEIGPPAWKSWFARHYPTISREFRGRTTEERTEGTWASFLEKERSRIREEFMKQSPYQRRERPGVFAPKIRTVQF